SGFQTCALPIFLGGDTLGHQALGNDDAVRAGMPREEPVGHAPAALIELDALDDRAPAWAEDAISQGVDVVGLEHADAQRQRQSIRAHGALAVHDALPRFHDRLHYEPLEAGERKAPIPIAARLVRPRVPVVHRLTVPAL